MNQPIDYLGAVQSTFNLAHTYNHRFGTRIQITQVKWAFCLDSAHQTRKAGDLNLATSTTSKQDLVHIEFSVDEQGFTCQPFGTPIPAFTNSLENALTTCLHVFESSAANSDRWVLSDSQVNIAFMLNHQNQLEFTEFSRDTENLVIHQITFTVRLKQ